MGSFYIGSNMDWPHLLEQSLRAHLVYRLDKEYVVERDPHDGEMSVIIETEKNTLAIAEQPAKLTWQTPQARLLSVPGSTRAASNTVPSDGTTFCIS